MEFKVVFSKNNDSPHEFEGTGEVEWKFSSRTLRMRINVTHIKDLSYLIETSIGNEKFSVKRDMDGPDSQDELMLAIRSTMFSTKNPEWVRVREFIGTVLKNNPDIKEIPGLLDQMVEHMLENCPLDGSPHGGPFKARSSSQQNRRKRNVCKEGR